MTRDLNTTTSGYPDRNAQFDTIAHYKCEYLKAVLPVVSIDTRK